MKLAREHQVLFMAGFNRRFAPLVADLAEVPHKNVIRVKKNRINDEHKTAWVLYDLFIHPLDTAVYLLGDELDGAKDITSKIFEDADGNLQRAFVRIDTENTTAIVSMNLKSGANTETVEVESLDGTYRIDNLVSGVKVTEEGTTQLGFSDWDTTLYKRGFETMVEEFLKNISMYEKLKMLQEEETPVGSSNYEEIRDYEALEVTEPPENKENRDWNLYETELKQDNVLLSHKIIAEMIRRNMRGNI
jgi:virulence factor